MVEAPKKWPIEPSCAERAAAAKVLSSAPSGALRSVSAGRESPNVVSSRRSKAACHIWNGNWAAPSGKG
eukprot:3616265-Prymnesium_polylepis.1